MDAKFFDSLFEGDSHQGVKLGMGLTGGDFWPRVDGCMLLYRGKSMDGIDLHTILAVAESDAQSIVPPSYFEHENGTTYFYVVRQANVCGNEEHALGCALRLDIDEAGGVAAPQPNAIFGAKVKLELCGKAELTWYYCPLNQNCGPLCFKVYSDKGAGSINYTSEIGTVEYTGRGFYRYVSGCLADGRHKFVIRAEDSEQVDDGSLTELQIQIGTHATGEILVKELTAV